MGWGTVYVGFECCSNSLIDPTLSVMEIKEDIIQLLLLLFQLLLQDSWSWEVNVAAQGSLDLNLLLHFIVLRSIFIKKAPEAPHLFNLILSHNLEK